MMMMDEEFVARLGEPNSVKKLLGGQTATGGRSP